jgi:hypothetical protein
MPSSVKTSDGTFTERSAERLLRRQGEAMVVVCVQYHLRSSDEDCKQLYCGAFMLGGAVFHQHRKAGYWLSDRALEKLAVRGFALLSATTEEDIPEVDDQHLGRRWFRDGFTAGYRQQATAWESIPSSCEPSSVRQIG